MQSETAELKTIWARKMNGAGAHKQNFEGSKILLRAPGDFWWWRYMQHHRLTSYNKGHIRQY